MLAELVASLDVFRFLLVFARIGAALMLMPGFGGSLVPTRVRLLLALGLSVLVEPVVHGSLPHMPDSAADLVVLLIGEVTVGLFLGLLAQAIMSALSLCGTYMGFQAGIANAFIHDPVTEQQSTLLPGFFANVAVVLIFATDTHHLMLRAAANSYVLFTPGAPLPLADFSDSMARMMTRAFLLGLQLAGPIMVFGIVFNAGLGLLSRLMPQLQVYFVAAPIQLMVGLLLVAASLPAVMMWFLRFFEDGLMAFAGGG